MRRRLKRPGVGGQAARAVQKLVATLLKKLLTSVPIVVAQPTHRIEMKAAISAYSIAVAPERSRSAGTAPPYLRSVITASATLLRSISLRRR